MTGDKVEQRVIRENKSLIMALSGPEGSGKTLYMTRMCLQHVDNGGKLFTFPGYRVHDKKGVNISEEIGIAEFLELVLRGDLTNIMLAIDEMQNWFDAYNWNSAFNQLFAAVGAQNRKLNLRVIGTIQDFKWLTPRLRWLTHLRVECNDYFYASRRRYPRGERIIVRYCDLKGFYTGRQGKWLHPVVVKDAKKYWQYYDTYAVVDWNERYTKLKVNKQVIEVDFNGDGRSDGEFIPNPDGLYIPNNGNGHEAAVDYVLSLYERNNIDAIPTENVRADIASQGVNIPATVLGGLIKAKGWIKKPKRINGALVEHYMKA